MAFADMKLLMILAPKSAKVNRGCKLFSSLPFAKVHQGLRRNSSTAALKAPGFFEAMK